MPQVRCGVMTPAQFRKLALCLPEAEEKSHFEQPDFRVRDKIFAGLSREGDQATLKLPIELQAMLLDSHPGAFTPAAGYWGRQGWTHAKLAAVDPGPIRELLHEAWRRVAPKRLIAATEAAEPLRPTGPARKSSARKAGRSTARKKKR